MQIRHTACRLGEDTAQRDRQLYVYAVCETLSASVSAYSSTLSNAYDDDVSSQWAMRFMFRSCSSVEEDGVVPTEEPE
jgi:hypothetical protein